MERRFFSIIQTGILHVDAVEHAVELALHHLHHALHNRKRSHIKISAKGLKTRIENDSDQAFCGLHDKGGHAQRRNPGYNLLFQSHIGQPDPKPGPLSTQKADNPAGTDSLGENCGQGRAAHPHLEPKNKNRVQDDI